MSNNNAFAFQIGNPDSGDSDLNFEKQMSPSWVLTFVRFQYRDLFRTPNSVPTQTAGNGQPLIVQNDCIQLETSAVKNNLTPSVKMVLLQTDIDYETAVAPGDFVLVNILNWDTGAVKPNRSDFSVIQESSADEIVNRVKAGLNVNRMQDGFKGVFRIQSVRKTIAVDPASGTKIVRFEITGFAFTEFNNALYFNPNLVNEQVRGNLSLYLGDISKAWASLNNFQGIPYVQELISTLIRIFLGSGTTSSITGNTTLGLEFSFNHQYNIPGMVGKLLGLQKLTSNGTIQAKDIYAYLFGIQQYRASSSSAGLTSAEIASGLNPCNMPGNFPNITEKYANFFYTNDFCAGNSTLKADYWNNVKLWSVLNQYVNSPLNELYTCFKTSFNGNVLPTVVLRQIPFTNDDFSTRIFGAADTQASTIKVTKFMNIPRWKISPYYIYNLNIGREDSARINFVQYFAKSLFTKNGMDLAAETAKHNYCFDSGDVQRSGLKPYIVSNDFSDLLDQNVDHATVWARILSDSLFGGQLKMNGSMETIGIFEPITIGDNLEFDNVVYHIEGIVHKCSISQNGIKSFRTTLTLSNGLSTSTTNTGVQYAQMTDENAYDSRITDYNNQKILPGVSDSQDTVNRNGNLDQITIANPPFPQPSEDN